MDNICQSVSAHVWVLKMVVCALMWQSWNVFLWCFSVLQVCICISVYNDVCLCVCERAREHACVLPLPRWLCSDASEICCQWWILIRDHCHIHRTHTRTLTHAHPRAHPAHPRVRAVEALIYTATARPPCWCFPAVQVTAATLITGLSVTRGDWHPTNTTNNAALNWDWDLIRAVYQETVGFAYIFTLRTSTAKTSWRRGGKGWNKEWRLTPQASTFVSVASNNRHYIRFRRSQSECCQLQTRNRFSRTENNPYFATVRRILSLNTVFFACVCLCENEPCIKLF